MNPSQVRSCFLTVLIGCLCFLCCKSDEETNDGANTPTTNASETLLVTPTENQTPSTGTLQDIWVLDSINKKAPDSTYFSHGTPYFDFNLEKNTVNGHTGCNGLSGKVKVDGQKLIFDSIVVTTQECKNKSFENRLLKGFKSGKTTYEILNEKLYLNPDANTEYVFRRIRRS